MKHNGVDILGFSVCETQISHFYYVYFCTFLELTRIYIEILRIFCENGEKREITVKKKKKKMTKIVATF